VRRQSGFTLIEVLMALTVFALIAAISYAAMGSAGQGFQMLSEVRDMQESSGWTGRQLRTDTACLAAMPPVAGQATPELPVQIHSDNRGDNEFDTLLLLVHEAGRPGTTEVRYYIDEDKGHLMRESRLLLARDSVEPVAWDMGEASSWAVEAMDKDGRWQQEWQTPQGIAFNWPKALRIRWKIEANEAHPASAREWYLPISYGVNL